MHAFEKMILPRDNYFQTYLFQTFKKPVNHSKHNDLRFGDDGNLHN
jgi:hypothetical protein